MKTFFLYLLLGANALLALMNMTGFSAAPGGEPDRLSSQLHPEKLKIIGHGDDAPAPEQAAADPAPVASELAPVVASSEAAPAAESAPVEAPATKPLALACVSWGGLTKAQADAIALRAKGLKFTAKEQTVNGTSSWWVHLPPQTDRAGADKKAEELRTLGVNDYFIVKDPGANQNAISLGLYKSEESANRALEALKTKGVRSARIEARDTSSIKLEVTGPADQLASFSSDTSSRVPSAPRANCPPGR
ncbi:SPOR domain-containing protein [Niveibacterium sp. COAC-50]|uniref:SPOR domain-containing protein n=1 Tax=Niveibacterium sp. COAC-50 TaxID=2729384 RepID=UPI0015574782|nr:SPOR domain-containing protein [Niveibacterium sp. COAC-50]